MKTRIFIVAAGALALTAFACAPRVRVGDTAATQASTSVAPHIASVTPESVTVARGSVVELVLRGSGFDPSPANTITIGPAVIASVAGASDGSSLRVTLPDAVRQSAEAPPAPWQPGRYAVTVRNARGLSDTVFVTILSDGGIR